MHKISLRDAICSRRVCDALLSLLATLVDFGLLANNATNESEKSKKKAANEGKNEVDGATDKETTNEESAGKSQQKQGPSSKDEKQGDEKEGTLSVHNTFMDVVVR